MRYRCRIVSHILEAAQGITKVFFERIDPDALDGFSVAVQGLSLYTHLTLPTNREV
jgi:predicted lipoprotein